MSAAVTGVYALARLLAGKPVDVGAVGRDDPLVTIVGQVMRANGEGPRAVFQRAIAGHPDAAELTEMILSIDATKEPASLRAASHPELPPEVRPDADLASRCGGWLDMYVRYAQSISPMTPSLFHESGGLWLGSTVIARRLNLPLAFADVFPNLYVMWTAPTTIFHKTTAMNVPRNITRAYVPHLLAPHEMTPEAFLSDMAGKEPTKYSEMSEFEQIRWQGERDFAAQRALALDEMSGLLALAGKDYSQGLIESFLRFYDCDPWFQRSTRTQGRVTVHNSYVSILGASTPKAMAPHLSSEMLWSNGWWPRFALLAPDVEYPEYQRPMGSGPPGDAITWPLMRLYKRLPITTWPTPLPAISVHLGDGVYAAWERYSKVLSYDLIVGQALDDRLLGTHGRLTMQAWKIAIILCAFDWPEGDPAPTIELPHLHRAIAIAETWRASAHRTIEQSAVPDENIKYSRMLRQIARHGLDGASHRDIGKAMKDVSKSEVERLIKAGVTAGDLVAVDRKSGTLGGRPTIRYRMAYD